MRSHRRCAMVALRACHACIVPAGWLTPKPSHVRFRTYVGAVQKTPLRIAARHAAAEVRLRASSSAHAPHEPAEPKRTACEASFLIIQHHFVCHRSCRRFAPRGVLESTWARQPRELHQRRAKALHLLIHVLEARSTSIRRSTTTSTTCRCCCERVRS